MPIKKINGYKIFLGEELGRGAYGAVYKGQQDSTKLSCAIKIIDKKNINSDPYLKSALFSEIQILGKLKSENIVRLFDVMQSSHNYYIVQELCDSDLEKYLKTNKKVTEREGRAMLTEICNGFLALVRQGIVHRDIKPANILIQQGKLKIADFGFAKENIHRRVKNESSVGTPLYMSVQVLKSQSYTSKCDIWAIGCIFYEMLHGKTPWTAKSQYELVTNIMQKPANFDENLSPETVDFLQSTLKVYEKDRICWDDLFKHKIFNGYFNSYLDENKQFENKYKKVMGDLRFKINSQNIDIKKLWASLGFQEDKELNFKEFQRFLHAINPYMNKAESSYFFQKMDANGDGSLSLCEISSELEKFGISLTSRRKPAEHLHIKRTMTLNKSMDEDSDGEESKIMENEQFIKRVHNCFIKLNNILAKKQITLYKTFVAYDADKNGELTVDEFSKIMMRLDNSFTPEEIQSIFKVIDKDGSKTIQFDEFNSYYCKINGIPLAMNVPAEYYDEAQKKATPYYQQKKKLA